MQARRWRADNWHLWSRRRWGIAFLMFCPLAKIFSWKPSWNTSEGTGNYYMMHEALETRLTTGWTGAWGQQRSFPCSQKANVRLLHLKVKKTIFSVTCAVVRVKTAEQKVKIIISSLLKSIVEFTLNWYRYEPCNPTRCSKSRAAGRPAIFEVTNLTFNCWKRDFPL